MKLFKLIVLLASTLTSLVSGFKLIPAYDPPVFLNLERCPEMDGRLSSMLDYMKTEEIPFVNLNEIGRKTAICNADFAEIHNNIGITYPHNKSTIVYIANQILSLPNTLYNVVLHEFGHVLGLHHSAKRGIMNHSITIANGRFLEDLSPIYPSIDDILGLMYQKTAQV
jgi:hypothetical protein